MNNQLELALPVHGTNAATEYESRCEIGLASENECDRLLGEVYWVIASISSLEDEFRNAGMVTNSEICRRMNEWHDLLRFNLEFRIEELEDAEDAEDEDSEDESN